MSRLPTSAAAVNMTTTMDVNASTDDAPDVRTQLSSPPNSQSQPAKPSTNTTTPRDFDGNPLTDIEQSDVETSKDAENHKTTEPFTLIEQQGDLLDFPHSIAHCISADFKLGAGIAKQIREKFPDDYPEKLPKQQVLHAQYLGKNKFIYHLIVKPRHFHKPTYKSLRKALTALRDHLVFYRIEKLESLRRTNHTKRHPLSTNAEPQNKLRSFPTTSSPRTRSNHSPIASF